MMSDYNIHPPVGSNHSKKYVGRGQGSGLGGTAGRGNKGQQSRSGGKTYPGFEGGQMPLYRRIAKRGFDNSVFRQDYQIVNLVDIERCFKADEIVEASSLISKGLIKKMDKPVKILGKGEVTKALNVVVDKISGSAKTKIESVGGKVEIR